MIATIRSEQIKLRTVTMNWVLTAIAVSFPVVVTLLNAFFQGDDDGFSSRSLVEVLSGTSFVSTILIGVVAATSITGEFGFGTIRPTFTATPRRARVVTAKAVVVVVLALEIQIGVVLVGWLGGASLAEGRGTPIDLGTVDAGLTTLIGTVVLAVLMALAGLGVGLLVRSTPGAVAALILWPLIVENLVGALLGLAFDGHDIPPWMPFQAGFSLARLEPFGGPSRLVAGLYFGAVALALVLVGTWTLHRRDA